MVLTATRFGVGPLAVGVLNDVLKSDFGNEAMRSSSLSATVTTMLGALLLVSAARFIHAVVQRAR